MFETFMTMVGKVVSEPVRHTFASGDQKTSFRLMSVERRLNRETQEWGDGDRLFLTVNCRRRLAENAALSLVKGDNVLVSGRLYTRSYTTEAGERRETYEIDARALGADLAWCTVVVERPSRPERALVGVSTGTPGEGVVAQRVA
ncbi:single-stranded DNA-binding protein [Actinophytocola gossypii]|uniref:Single-stranded DNA-binding protein n=1 Tax=Actinophytocola gossypii TaxID=2812003 RepID=A0ABT2JG77_9PSEU|nr:single-stranded DNA-binding protein [Actinophytocola gossypii]MCT2586877.1 single-stranded DNA-binding protein [Actinophytocola gossypii]